MPSHSESANSRLEFARTAIKAVLEVAFILFIMTIVFVYANVSLTAIFDDGANPINPERFNQIWTSTSGIVGTIVGWMIREITSGKNGIAQQEHLKKEHAVKENELWTEIEVLRGGLRESSVQVARKDEKINSLQSEMDVMQALGTKGELDE